MIGWIRGHHGPIRWKARDNARSGATPLTSQPQTNPNYQFVNALYSSLALFETTNRVLQLVETTLVASLITQRSLVQIQPPQPNLLLWFQWVESISPYGSMTLKPNFPSANLKSLYAQIYAFCASEPLWSGLSPYILLSYRCVPIAIIPQDLRHHLQAVPPRCAFRSG